MTLVDTWHDPAPRLPHSPENERAILGGVILDNSKWNSVRAQGLVVGHFFISSHRRIFAAMEQLVARARPIEEIGLFEILRDDPEIKAAGGVAYLSQLADGLHRDPHIEHRARTVMEKACLRELAWVGQEITQAALEEQRDPQEAVRRIREIVDSLRTTSALRSLSLEELMAADVAPREMVLEPILPTQGLAMLHSARGAGKTYLALAIAYAVSTGGPCLRWNAPKPRRVLYVDGELPASVLRTRLVSITSGAGRIRPGADMLRIISPDFQDCPMPDLSSPSGQRMIEANLEGIELLILDNLSCLCRSGKENEGESWLPVQEWLLRMRQRGLSVLFLHHSGKAGAQRGTSRREDVLDSVFTLRRPSDYNTSQGLRVELHFEKLRTHIGENARPFEIVMQTDEHGAAVWTTRDVEDLVEARAVHLFSDGVTVRDVAEELGISKSKAGRLKKQIQSRQRLGAAS